MAEVAGLVVGVIPLIAVTVKQYSTVRRICRRFRHVKIELKEVVNDLKIHQAIFRNETRLLLAAALKADEVELMTQDADSELWHSAEIDEKFQQILGDSRSAIEGAVQRVSSQLSCLEREVEKFASLEEVEDSSPKHRKGREILTRFSFSISGEKLRKMSTSVARATKDYRVLRAQLQDLETSRKRPDHPSKKSADDLVLISATQTAAKQFYQALLDSCSKHDYHVAHFSLQPVCTSSEAHFDIQFQVAYRHRQQIQKQDDVLWFQVQSSVIGDHHAQQATSLITATVNETPRSCKRIRSFSAGTGDNATSKRVRFRSPSPIAMVTQPSAVVPQLTSAALEAGAAVLTDFCTKLRTYHLRKDATGCCIGMLRSASNCEHRIFASTGPDDHPSGIHNQTRTLAALLSSNPTTRRQLGPSLTFVQRLRLAKLFAQAVLSYHSTPWLQKPWRSKDVILYGSTVPCKTVADREEFQPFLEVPVCESSNGATQHQANNVLRAFVRNLELFDLGIILLELAYEMPLADMLEATDCKAGMPPATIDFFAAIRLSKEVSTCMGTKYAKIVEQCLSCSFGQGVDLAATELQDSVNREVISELDRLATGFENLGLR